MGNDVVIITINGTDYYVPSNMVQYISDSGISTYSSSFSAYASLSSVNYSRYPRVTFPSCAYPVLYQSNTNYTELVNPTIVFSKEASFYRLSNYFPFFSLFLIGFIMVAVWFRRFR